MHQAQTLNTLRLLPDIQLIYGMEYLNKQKVYLPPPRYNKESKVLRKKTLIFDLDETLIHCLDDAETASPDITVLIPVTDPDSSVFEIQGDVIVRPHLYETLKELTNFYQLIIFTASEQSYADSIVDCIDPNGTLFDARLYRQHCIETSCHSMGSTYVKDLRIIANRDLREVLIVDNSALCFSL